MNFGKYALVAKSFLEVLGIDSGLLPAFLTRSTSNLCTIVVSNETVYETIKSTME